MKLGYMVVKDGKVFMRSIVVRRLDDYYDYLDDQNLAHQSRATGFSFHSL